MLKFTSFPNFRNIQSSTIKSLSSFFSSLPKTQNSNCVFQNYLIEFFNFPESRALAVSNRYAYVESLEKPQNVCQYFRTIGLSDAHIQTAVRVVPQVLLMDVEKTLKPKIEFFQRLGVAGSDLGELISKRSFLLTYSLEKKLIPRIEILQQVLGDDKNNKYLIRILRRCGWNLINGEKSRLLNNVELFKRCGIVGSRLSLLVSNKPRLLVMPEFQIKKLVSQLSDMGISGDSRMFYHGLYALSGLSEETSERKMELLKSYGISRDEFIEMFRKAPMLLLVSKKKLQSGLEFFLKEIELEKAALCSRPVCLMYSMENRVIPRYRVFKLLMSRGLLKKQCTFPQLLPLTEEKFLQRFVLMFRDDAEELFLAFKGQSLGSLSLSSS
ncbi:Transcription termination factor like [Melia azedarach]|uniref:Transcription termination factor like n=2 Tax=Melia azedarach TaxID=155640 RepID=A0ACC1XW42_MELAZ|nr:Transcription termination factor like [Melia azedarach]KAJ4715563.1 Transcription termination factor like [Melia azedarach]